MLEIKLSKTPGYPDVFPFAVKMVFLDGKPLLGKVFPPETEDEEILLWAEEVKKSLNKEEELLKNKLEIEKQKEKKIEEDKKRKIREERKDAFDVLKMFFLSEGYLIGDCGVCNQEKIVKAARLLRSGWIDNKFFFMISGGGKIFRWYGRESKYLPDFAKKLK